MTLRPRPAPARSPNFLHPLGPVNHRAPPDNKHVPGCAWWSLCHSLWCAIIHPQTSCKAPPPGPHLCPTVAHLRPDGCRRGDRPSALPLRVLCGGQRASHPESPDPSPAALALAPSLFPLPASHPTAAPHLGPREAAEPGSATWPGTTRPSLQHRCRVQQRQATAGPKVSVPPRGGVSGLPAPTSAFLRASLLPRSASFQFCSRSSEKMEVFAEGARRPPGPETPRPCYRFCILFYGKFSSIIHLSLCKGWVYGRK